MIKSIFGVVLFFLVSQISYSQNVKIDSVKSLTLSADSSFVVDYHNRHRGLNNKYAVFEKRVVNNPAYKILHASVPLFVAGGIAFAFDKDFYDMRSGYIPGFHNSYDDYLQYAPAAIMVAMKAFGVKGRSSWGRMLVSDAFSVGAMVILVNGLKYTVSKERPDGSARNSFPSGHTATAFMTATMFHKEYGMTRSPLYSVLGYSLATATAVSRQLNNRHWMSDVLFGAGIGILSVELGYYLADLVFKERGLKMAEMKSFDDAYLGNPNFFGIKAGYTFLNQTINFANGISIQSKGGANAAIEGAWFFNRYFGVGARVSALNSPILIGSNGLQYGAHDKVSSGQSLKILSVNPGFYISYPLAYGMLVGARIAPSIDISDNVDIARIANENSINVAHLSGAINAGLQAGISITKMTSSNFGLSINLDYSAYFTKLNGASLLYGEMRNFTDRRTINSFSISASANAYLFKRKK